MFQYLIDNVGKFRFQHCTGLDSFNQGMNRCDVLKYVSDRNICGHGIERLSGGTDRIRPDIDDTAGIGRVLVKQERDIVAKALWDRGHMIVFLRSI